MRKLSVLSVVALLLAMIGDGRKVPPPAFPTFSDGVCVVPPPDPMPGRRSAFIFWYRSTGEERRALSVPAGIRVRRAYQRVVARANALGIRVEPLKLRQTKPELALILGPGIRYMFAAHYTGSRTILFNGWWLDQMEDWEVEYLTAHEVGHAIDLQYERRGHWLLDTFAADDPDDFVADMLTLVLTDPRSLERFEQKYPWLSRR